MTVAIVSTVKPKQPQLLAERFGLGAFARQFGQ